MREEWGLRGQCVSRKRSFQEARDLKRVTAQLYWLRKTRPHKKALRADPTRVKNMMELQWMARVGLARPSASLRSFSVTLRDLCGDGNTVSRTQIGRIRDAFVQTLLELRGEELRKIVAAELRAPAAATGAVYAASATCAVASKAATGAAASDAATGARRRLRAVVVLHLHDEASLRLRSHLGGAADLPSRSRSSKVQQHVVKVFLRPGLSCEVPQEMEALGDKTAATLATSLDGRLRQVAKTIAAGLGNDNEAWLIHVLVGDAINTNEAAARRLYAKAAVAPIAAALKYCLVVVKCASHQANLAAKGAAIGVAATVCNAATRADAEGAKADTAAIGAATTQPTCFCAASSLDFTNISLRTISRNLVHHCGFGSRQSFEYWTSLARATMLRAMRTTSKICMVSESCPQSCWPFGTTACSTWSTCSCQAQGEMQPQSASQSRALWVTS